MPWIRRCLDSLGADSGLFARSRAKWKATTNRANASSLVPAIHENLSEARGWLSSRVLSVYDFTQSSCAHSQAPSSKLAPRAKQPAGTCSATTNWANASSLVSLSCRPSARTCPRLEDGYRAECSVLSVNDFTDSSCAHSQAPSSMLAPRALLTLC